MKKRGNIMRYSLLILVIAGVFAYIFYGTDNPIYHFASRLVKVDDTTLKQMEKNSSARKIHPSECRLEANFDFSCAPVTTAGLTQQYPHYFWGAPGAKLPRTETAENCAKACSEKGNGFCAWRENGPEFNGGTACYFVSAEICNHSSMINSPFANYLPSQVTAIKSGRCE
jgi:hypothetical protein